MRAIAKAGALFVLLSVAAFVFSVGALVGSFADPDAVFVDRYAESDKRVQDIVGSYLLALDGLAFAWFAHGLGRAAKEGRTPLLITGTLAAGGMILAAIAWATVPLSLWFGSLVDDPGLQEGQAVLPQFGYVALTIGGMLPAAVFIFLVARTPGLVPRWLSVGSYPVAVLVALSALLFMPVLLLGAWVLGVAGSHARRRISVPASESN